MITIIALLLNLVIKYNCYLVLTCFISDAQGPDHPIYDVKYDEIGEEGGANLWEKGKIKCKKKKRGDEIK